MKDKEFKEKIKKNRFSYQGNKDKRKKSSIETKSIEDIIEHLKICFRNNIFIPKTNGELIRKRLEREKSLSEKEIRDVKEMLYLMAFQNIKEC